jgi:hypothetical protein
VDLDAGAIGRNSRFEYDRLGRLTAEQDVSATTGAVLTRVEYQLNEAGQRTSEVWTAGPLANRSVLLPTTALDRSHPPVTSGRMARQSWDNSSDTGTTIPEIGLRTDGAATLWAS